LEATSGFLVAYLAPPWAGVVVVDMVLRGTLCEDAFLFIFFPLRKRKKEEYGV
jgi:hypothetical protein